MGTRYASKFITDLNCCPNSGKWYIYFFVAIFSVPIGGFYEGQQPFVTSFVSSLPFPMVMDDNRNLHAYYDITSKTGSHERPQ